MKDSPLHKKIKTSSTQEDAPKKMGFSKKFTKIKKTKVPKPSGGFMHPPYKKPVGPTEGPHYVHGYKK